MFNESYTLNNGIKIPTRVYRLLCRGRAGSPSRARCCRGGNRQSEKEQSDADERALAVPQGTER